MFNDVGGWDRTEIDIDSDDRASWIENGSPCPESPVQMAGMGVAGLARDLQHSQCTSASWSLLFSWSPVIKCQPDSRQRGEEVPRLPVTRGCGEALQECYQATDWLWEIFWCQSSVLQTLLWQCAGSQQTQNWKKRKHGFTRSSQFTAESLAVCGVCGVSRL